MKIESIHLENFGIYGSKRFRFDGQPLILIYGANESGKTTTLNGLRQALFGFPRSSAYGHAVNKRMCAEGQLTLADGRKLRFVRQKKNSDPFSATIDGRIPLSESQWNELTSGLDLKAYQSLFGFSLDELRNGEKALAHASIDQALSSSGLGGLARLQAVQNRIESFLGDTLKRQGSSGIINAKVAEIQAAEQYLESVLTLPADVTALRNKLADAQQLVQVKQDQLNSLRAQLAAAERRRSALPTAIQYQQTQTSLGQYELPAELDSEFRLQWTVLFNKLAGLRSELQAETRKLQSWESELASLPAAQGVAAHQSEAIALGKQARNVPTWRNQVADASRELADIERDLAESLRKLDWSIQDTRWRNVSLDLNQLAELDAARSAVDQLDSQLRQCITRIDVTQQQLHNHLQPAQSAKSAERDLTWDDVLELETLVRHLRPQAQELDQKRKELARRQSETPFKQLVADLHSLTALLSGSPEPIAHELSTTWSVPPSSEARQLQASLAQAIERLASAKEAEEGLSARRDALRAEIASTQTKAGVKSLAELEAIWCQRDSIVAHWHEELRTPLLASTVSPTEHEERLALLRKLNQQSDTAVRNMLAAVEQVAVVAAQERQLAELERTLQQQVRDRQSLEQAHQQVLADWQKLWAGCALTSRMAEVAVSPKSSYSLVQWLDSYLRWRQGQEAIDALASDLTSSEQAYALARQQLCERWPEAASFTSLSQAEKLVGKLRGQLATVDAQATMLKSLEQTFSSSLTQRRELEAQLSAGRQVVEQVLLSFGLPETWPPTEVTTRLEALKRCQKLATRADALRTRRAKLEQEIAAFERSVVALGKQLNVSELSKAPEEHAVTWMDQFLNRERADHRRLELGTLIADQQGQCAKRTDQIAQFEADQRSLMARIGGQSVPQVQSWIEQAATVIQLRARQAELTAALQSSAADQTLDEFLQELAELNPRSVTATVASLNAQVSSLEADLTLAQQAVGGLVRELEFKEQGSAALEAEQRLKRLRSELVELAEQWAVHKLAGELLTRTIDRFTHDHEPELLKYTRRFFRELTDDRYAMVEHDSGKHGGFAVRDQNGHGWSPDKLSTGTREQLYLAIRLAFITHFNSHHEPLPVIMDDCFVNFDDTRARIALRTLVHWQESEQTILLSCHWRSVEALAELAPETPVLEIASGQMSSAREMAMSRRAVAGEL